MFKRVVILSAVAALLGTPVLHSNAVAESGFDKFKQRVDEVRPRGRLLKKIFGIDEETDEKAKKEADEKAAAAKQAAAREAAARSGRSGPQPTPAKRPPTMRQPTPPPRTESSRTQSTRANPNYRQASPAAVRPQTSGQQQTSRDTQQPRRSSKKISMGVTTTKTSKGLRITRIKSGSPADKAGMKSGDYILELAGLPADDEDVLNGIADALNDGDQVEAKISRGGKKEMVMIQFGEPPVFQSNASPKELNARNQVAPGPMSSGPMSSGPTSSGPMLSSPSRTQAPQSTRTNQSNVSGEIETLRQTVRDQQRVIGELQRQLQSQRASQFRGR